MNDWGPVIVALSLAIPVLAAAIASWLQGHANGKAIAEVHTLVNSTHQESVARVAQLEAVLTAKGSPVPPPRSANQP